MDTTRRGFLGGVVAGAAALVVSPDLTLAVPAQQLYVPAGELARGSVLEMLKRGYRAWVQEYGRGPHGVGLGEQTHAAYWEELVTMERFTQVGEVSRGERWRYQLHFRGIPVWGSASIKEGHAFWF